MQKKQRNTRKMKSPVRKKSTSAKLAMAKGPTDYNLRFDSPEEYSLVRKAAEASKQSINKFILVAAIDRANRTDMNTGPQPVEPVAG